jgi:uncharacterized phage protein (TIGR01671 family)
MRLKMSNVTEEKIVVEMYIDRKIPLDKNSSALKKLFINQEREMRAIKFRAWDEGGKVMHHNFQFIKSGDEGNDWIIFISDEYPLTNYQTNPFTNPNPYFAQQLKIMQFTGLFDKSGKEIYEGDIVKWRGNERIFEVMSIIGGGYRTVPLVMGIRQRRELSEWRDLLHGNNLLEIIGNVYENEEVAK